jgi:hypothetical protein
MPAPGDKRIIGDWRRQGPQGIPIAVGSRLKTVGGCLNEDVLVDAYTDIVTFEQAVKLNKMTIVGYAKLSDELYKLWTSGGWNFYTKNDDFLKEKKQDGEQNSRLEIGESRTPNISD